MKKGYIWYLTWINNSINLYYYEYEHHEYDG